MRSLITLLFFIAASSQAFITHDQVVIGIKKKENRIWIEKDNSLTEKDLFIKKNLVPLSKLIPEKVQKELDQRKKKFQEKIFTIKNGQGIDLRKFDTPIKQQWNGTCTTFGLTACIENVFKGKFDLSERDMWDKYKQYSSRIAVKTMESKRICEEKFWPIEKTRPSINCSENRKFGLEKGTVYFADDIKKALDHLDTGFPVYIGMSTPKEMYRCNQFIHHNSGKTGGGHALAIVGYKLDSRLNSGGYFILKNSWGPDCGDKGYQYLDHDFCKQQGRYCVMWGIKNVIGADIEPTPINPILPPESPKVCLKWKRPWYYLGLKKVCTKWSE